MQVTILQENLLRALLRTARIVPTKPQLPIVQNVLLTTDDGRLKITATNLETTESVWVAAKIEKEGGICVSSRLLSDFVSSLPQGTVQMGLIDGALSLRCEGFRATIPGAPAEEFPPVFSQSKTKGLPIDRDELVSAVSQVIFAAATDEGRPLLTGVKIVQKDGALVLMATDGYRLSVRQTTLKAKEELDIIVPARALGEVIKVCGEEKSTKEVHIARQEDGQLSFVVGDTEIRTRLIDGEYPNIQKIIPTKHNTRVVIEKESLLRAVKAASIFARDNANIIRFHIEGQMITVTANTPQVGEDEIDVEAKVEGEGGDMAFNSRFLVEFLANYPSEELVFEMTGSLNPGVFKPVKEDTYLHIIMPVRVQG
jgi:DNA polymerase III subunit beta